MEWSSLSKVAACLALAFAMAAAAMVVQPCAAQNSLKDEFVSLHNAARAQVGVGSVSWDNKVAAYAQSYADARKSDCALQHSTGPYGENIYKAWGSSAGTASDAVGSWVAEKKYYHHNTNTCDKGQWGCLHYTQVVWRASTTIGCARVVCDYNQGMRAPALRRAVRREPLLGLRRRRLVRLRRVGYWVAEKQYYDHASNSCATGRGRSAATTRRWCGLWSSSTNIGCASVVCNNSGGVFIICSYNPPGNIVGESPYSPTSSSSDPSAMAYSLKLACLALAIVSIAVAAMAPPSAAQNSPQDYVDLHNAARADVGVGEVSWDDTVAAYAQSYAAQRQGDCQLVHSSGGPYGENLFGGSAGADWSASDAVGSWVSEKQYYDHDTNSCAAPAGQDCLHYTQVVWRDSTAIGCARVDCDNAAGVFIICSYNPRGNVVCIGLLVLAMAAATVVVTPCAAQNSAQDFVRPHNAARAAVGVGPVSWDNTVAAFAQSYAAQRKGDCALRHSGGGPNHYGENIFVGGAGKAWSASDAVGLWVAEKQYYHHDTNSCAAGKVCGHYTQVVWRASTAIGCARVVCDNGGVFITCNYKPAGNIIGQSPY
ncbi:hypothetical protein U9M48_011594 [Paspalum notatum var. saurae]|uniref:SCP domain-containing protein n=1 Tax=Paspalum notatum var. saurae TaxID=547442 RepID=A0AAQ3SWM6_PASNO